jgi:hypothetical protein
MIHRGSVSMMLSSNPHVGSCQVIVERPDYWRVLVFTADGTDGSAITEAWLRERANKIEREILGPTVKLHVAHAERPEASPGGKALPIINHCWDQPPYSDT